jgi:osmotically inducible protein OsmC
MPASSALAKAGTPPTSLDVKAKVDFQPGQGITEVRLEVRGDVPIALTVRD